MARGSLLKPAFRKERADKGLAPWCVNVPPYLSDTGKRRQLFYDTQAEAKTVCQQYVTRRANFGVSLATLSPKLISEAAECYERLKPYKVNLLDVVNAYIDMQRQRAASISFLELCNQYIHSRPDRNRDHLKGLENTRDRFPTLHAKMVSDVTHRDLEPLLEPISSGGRNLIMRHLRAFFNFGIKKKYLTENPIAALDFTRRPKKEVEVISVNDVHAMLNAALSDDIPLLPYLVFGFFAGVRPEDELMGLEWKNFDRTDGMLTIRAEVAKTGRRRFIKLEPNALEWLRAYEERGGPMTGKVVRYLESPLRSHRLVNRAAAHVTYWPNSAMRHSFCSYHLAKFKDINTLTLAIGHTSPSMLFEHYNRGTREIEAIRFWEIRPPGVASNVVSFQKNF
jgi:integrase